MSIIEQAKSLIASAERLGIEPEKISQVSIDRGGATRAYIPEAEFLRAFSGRKASIDFSTGMAAYLFMDGEVEWRALRKSDSGKPLQFEVPV